MGPSFGMRNVPSVAEYVRALTALGDRITNEHRSQFHAHYHAPGRAATAKQLATWTGAAGVIVVNSLYGRLGHAICDELGTLPPVRSDDTYQWWSIWSRGWDTPGGFVWQMLPQVAEALERLGWVDAAAEFATPDEIPASLPLVEGAVRRVTVNAYERNREARRQCIAAHGTTCCICGFSFGVVYGPEADGYTHVHHLTPLSEIGGEYVIDPAGDLRPVCPNCHAVLHLGGRCRTVEEVADMLARQRAAAGANEVTS